METPGRRPRSGLELLIASLEELVPGLERLIELEEARLAQSSAPAALARGALNGLFACGMVPMNGLTWSADFAVDFAAVAVADPLGAGPLLVSTDANGGSLGAGVAQLAVNDAVCVPLTGRHLQITSAANKAVFVAVYAEQQPFSWAKA